MKRAFTALMLTGLQAGAALLPVQGSLAPGSAAPSDPRPGDVFREYSYNENINFMIERGVYKDSVQIEIFVDDTEDAVRLEFGATYWGGHIGTSNQLFRVNRSPRYEIPHPDTPGTHYCYVRNVMGRKARNVPLEYLKEGENTVTLYCGPQICYGFDWPHYIVYSAFLRVYYRDSKLPGEPEVLLLDERDELTYYPTFRLSAKNPENISSVDFLGKYLDYDRAGDGRFYKWHYQILDGEWKNTLNHPPFYANRFECQWINSWVPLQEKPVEFAACVTFKNGLKYMTESLKDLSFDLPYPVKMYVPEDVPEAFDVRNGQEKECTVVIPGLEDAQSAMLAIASWSGATSTGSPHQVSINGVQLADNFGVYHDFSYDMLPVPVHMLKEGRNTITFYSEYEGHALEVLWPGPALLVKYDHSVQNPFITHLYTADPSARVFNDTLYVYPSHDPDTATWFTMVDWHVFSTTDMRNWTDHGVALSLDEISWADRYAWAPDCEYKNGKYYFYFPTDQDYIGVAVGDRPAGPFNDALGEPLITRDTPGVVANRDLIDPAIFIDDDGTPYLYFGQNHVNMVRLNEDMISFDGPVHIIEGADHFFEAVWVHKYNGTYYLSYSGNGKILYGTGDSPYGPFEYKGVILDEVNSGTNHHSIVEYKGQWYLFYHTSDLYFRNHPDEEPVLDWEGINPFRRSIAVDYLHYNDDGTIRKVEKTRKGVDRVN